MNSRTARRALVRVQNSRASLPDVHRHMKRVRAARNGENMNQFILTAAALAALLSVTPGFAADISAGDTIIVTATRTEIPLDEAIVPVHVITREDIELSMATDLAELLRFEAGLDIGRNGGPGQATSVFLRGTESNHTLVLIDGVRVNPGTIGGAAIQHISPELIERVEIIKGARSALFGTDAIGGVINIITRRASENHLSAGVGGGSFGSRSAQAAGGWQGEAGGFGASVSWQDTEGFAPRTDSPVERGYDNLSANIYGARRFGDSELSVRHWRASGRVEYLDFFLTPIDQDYSNSATALQLDTRFSAASNSKIILSHMQDDIRQNQSPDFVESSRVSIDWQFTRALERHTLTGGLYFVEENARTLSFGSGFDEDTRTRAVFAQDQIAYDRHRAFVAVRLTDHETFGDEVTWNAEYAFDINEDWTLQAGIGRAFRAPDATDRYGFGGNPDLQPELADNAQVGIRYAAGSRHRFDVEYYANDIEDLIEFDFSTFTLVNVDQARIRGTQVGYEYRGDAFTLRTEVVSQEADNASTGTRLLRRAERSATVTYTHNIGSHRVGVALLASSDREDFGGVTLDGYVVANLTAQFSLGARLELNARVENLFDERYETAANFRMQERSAFVALRYAWQ